MSSIDFELDVQPSLEREWRRQYEACIAARADFQSLAAQGANAEMLDSAQERLDRAEALRARIMAKIDFSDARFFDID